MPEKVGNLYYTGKDRVRLPCGEELCGLVSSTLLIIIPSITCTTLTLFISKESWLPGTLLILPYLLSTLNSVRLILQTAHTEPGIIPKLQSE
jgi:hypothetical protein